MAQFMTVTEARTWFSHALTDAMEVDANEEIIELSTIIENAPASIINIACVFSNPGKLYYVDENGNENYLTDPSKDFPAKYTIIASLFLKKDAVISLRYSSDAIMHHLYVSHGAGVF